MSLTLKIAARDLQDHAWTLATIGDAAKFIDANFSAGRKSEERLQATLKVLQAAAMNGDYLQRERATTALTMLLKAEGMF